MGTTWIEAALVKPVLWSFTRTWLEVEQRKARHTLPIAADVQLISLIASLIC
jgi:hypothetical protein